MGRFKPLTLGLVEEGRFEEALNAELARVQAEMVRYVKRHGTEASKKAKGKVLVSLTLAFEGPAPEDFSIKGELKSTLPARPPAVTRALADETDDGTPALFVRASGSTADTPKQGVLTTQSGDVVDAKTGEVVREGAAKKR